MAKNLPAMQEMHVRSLGQKDFLKEAWQPTPVFLSGESRGQRNLPGCSTQGHKESDTTEANEHARILTDMYTYTYTYTYTHTRDCSGHVRE